MAARNDTFSGPPKRKGGHKKEQALAALLANPTRKAAAESCGIGLRTLQKWLTEPEFAEQYQQAKCELVNSLIAEIRNDGSRLRRALMGIAEDVEAPAAARVSAAGKLFDILFRQHENEFIVQRLDQWERERGTDEKGF